MVLAKLPDIFLIFCFLLCFQMVQDPTQFDVLVMPNLYGDILRSAPVRRLAANRKPGILTSCDSVSVTCVPV